MLYDVDEGFVRDMAEFGRKRMEVWHRKEVLGEDPPWTDDEVLRKYKFINIYRELDHMTRFEASFASDLDSFREKLRWIVLFRHTISKHTAPYLFREGEDAELSEVRRMYDELKPREFVSTAIQFFPPPGMDRAEHIHDYGQVVERRIDHLAERISRAPTAEYVLKKLQQCLPRIGPFKSYEMYTSLTYMDEFPFEEDEVFVVGPGAVPAVREMFQDESLNEKDSNVLPVGADRVAEALKNAGFRWLPEDRALDTDAGPRKFTTRTFEDLLCEYRKYLNIKRGKHGMRRYKPREGDPESV